MATKLPLMTTQSPSTTNPSASPAFAPRVYHGGCLCGAVRYEATIDFSQGTIRCNCTLCTKAALWSIPIQPAAFQLLSGEESLTDFQRNGRFAHYLFCKHCGVRSFARGDAPWMGGPYVSIYVNCLDDADLNGVEIRHYDGLHDAWENPRRERYVG